MSDREDINEQPRKKVRLTGPDDASVAPQSDTTNGLSAEAQAQIAQEQKAGITVWATDAPGFTGIVKKRYTDFLVNEILPNKHVLHLDDIPEPSKRQQKPKKESQPGKKESQQEHKKALDGLFAAAGEQKKEEANGGEAVAGEAEAGAAKVEENASAAQNEKDGQAVAKKEEVTEEKVEEEAADKISPADKATVESIFGEKTTRDLCRLFNQVVSKPGKKARDFQNFQSSVISDKQARTDAHITVRRVFKGLIETMTGDDNTIHIKACPSAAASKPRQDPRNNGNQPKGKVGWDELGGEFVHFTLYKENKDTMEVLYFMASQLKLAIKNFGFAGTKDRRGVTVQRVAAYRIPADRLIALNRSLRAARMGGFKHQKSGLELGDLYGNEFNITLRDCTFPGAEGRGLDEAKAIVDKALTGFQQTGFINYYGLQRFGSFSISTDSIGKKMLQGDLEGACDLILSYTPTALAAAKNPTAPEHARIGEDDMARAEAINIWETTEKMGDALDKLPRRFQAENAIIRHLGWVDRKSGELRRRRDWQGALMGIARNLRLMYVHAYQSLVWNTCAGKRWELYGSKVVEGDLVLVNEHKDKEAKKEEEVLEDVDADGEVIIRPAADDAATTADERFERARALTKEEAESGKYTIFDIVLPLPGYDVTYPPNAAGAYYKEFMGSERGGKLDPNDMRRKWKDISLSGGYRKLMSRPENVSWEVRTYKNDEQLVETDLEKLIGRNEADKTRSAAASGYGKGAEDKDGDAKMTEEVHEEGEEKIAVVLKMQLGSSQYATMALRELTKGGAVTFTPDFKSAR